MAQEIERKYRVTSMDAVALPDGIPIDQGYLSDGNPTVRVRTMGDKGFLTVKSRGKNLREKRGALVREEFEYEIPFDHAKALLELCRSRLNKSRHHLAGGVELDIFEGRHEGLVVAEYESTDGSHPAPIKGIKWHEVTADSRYSNSWIARHGIPEEDD